MTFTKLSTFILQIEETSSRNSITQLLATLFRETDKEEIQALCYLLQGKVAPSYQSREFGLADKFVIRAIAQTFGIEQHSVETQYKKIGDLGIVAQQLSHKEESKLSIQEVYDALFQLTDVSGEGSQEKKITLLSSLFNDLDRLSLRYVTRIPLGKMRLGFSDMTILDGISWMLTGDKTHRNKLEESFNVRPDIGYIARQVKKDGIDGISNVHMIVGAPIIPCLCQRIPTAEEMIEKMGTVSVEPKYDGVRVQIHFQRNPPPLKLQGARQNAEVKTFSRNLESTTDMFPELQHIQDVINADSVILDAEAVGVHPITGDILPFQETTTRKRKHNVQEALASVPLRFYVFDILYRNKEELLSVPLSKRRTILESTLRENTLLVLAPHIVTDDPAVILEYHEKQRNAGLEGIVVKQWEAPYEPGRRGFTWVKLKQEEGAEGKLSDTIDAVVMGYYRGEGKRTDFGIGAFLVGIRDDDMFVTVSKIGTGVSDDQWKQLRSEFEKEKAIEMPHQYKLVNKLFYPDVWIHPKIVVEVAGDDLTKSSNHGAGVAIRFPRLVRVREDKSPNQVTSLEEINKLFSNQ